MTNPSRLDHPLDISREARDLDESGTPAALIELARSRDDLVVLEAISDEQVLVEWPMGQIWRRQTRCARFARLRTPIDGCRYALVRAQPDVAEERPDA